MGPAHFELRREADELIYRFTRCTDPEGHVGFKRTDGDHWIVRHPRLSWIAGAWGSDEVYGRPWDLLAPQSDEAPPEGKWVSRKGAKAYVYQLVYLDPESTRYRSTARSHASRKFCPAK